MNNCNTCGTIYPSSCINYAATLPLQGLVFPGIPNLDDILQQLAGKLDDLKNALDISSVDKRCFAFNPQTDAQKVFLVEVINKICDIETEIGTLQTQLTDIGNSILNTPVNVDLKCLLPNPNPCGGVYTLGQSLQLIINRLCP